MCTIARRLSAFLHQLKALTFNDLAMVSYTIASSMPTRTRHVHASAHVTRMPVYAPEDNFLSIRVLWLLGEVTVEVTEANAHKQNALTTPHPTYAHAYTSHQRARTYTPVTRTSRLRLRITPAHPRSRTHDARTHLYAPIHAHSHITHTRVGSSSYHSSTNTNRSSTDHDSLSKKFGL